MMILSPAASSVAPRGTNSVRAALDRDDQRAARQVQLAERRGRQRRRGVELVLEQPDHAAGKHLRVDRAGRGHDLLDVGRQLRLRPQHAVDAELREAVPLRSGNEIRARHQADGFGAGDAVGDRAGDDVDFVEAGAGDEELRACSMPARPSTSSLVPLPTMNSTSIDENTSATARS